MGTESMGAVGADLRQHREPPSASAVTESLRRAGSQAMRGWQRLSQMPNERRVAAGLGWFSIGLGVFELAAPVTLSRLIGVAPGFDQRRFRSGVPARLADPSAAQTLLIRAFGLREITSGIGILTQRRPTAWLWSRVLGDAMDLSMLGLALSSARNRRGRLAVATAAVAGVTALDVLTSLSFSRSGARGYAAAGRARAIEATMIVNRSPEDCYRFWHQLENLPRFMTSLESVRVESEKRSHWVARTPAGGRLEWTAEIVHDTPNRLISWRSLDSDVPHAGTVYFDPAPGGRGTLVRVRMHQTPGARFAPVPGRWLRKLPEARIREELRHFKQVLETGEIPTTRGQPHGRRSVMARALSWRM